MSGPPFSVTTQEIAQLLGNHHALTCVESKDILEVAPRFKNKGVTRMVEHVLLLERRTP